MKECQNVTQTRHNCSPAGLQCKTRKGVSIINTNSLQQYRHVALKSYFLDFNVRPEVSIWV